MQLWEPNKKLADKKLENFSSKSQCDKKNRNLPQKSFSSKRSYGQAESSFHSSIKVCLSRSQRICWFFETVKKTHTFLRESTFLRIVSVKHGKQFWQPRRKFSDIKPKFFSSNVRRRYEKHKFFKKLKNRSMDTKRTVLTTPPKKFQQVAKFFQLKIIKC